MLAQHTPFLRRVLELLEVLVVPCGRCDRHARQQPATGGKPLAPFVVVLAITATDQITCKQRQPRIRCGLPALSYDPADMTEVLVLGITEIQHGQRLASTSSGTEVLPCTPGALPLHPVGIQRVGLQAIDQRTMMLAAAVFGLQQLAARSELSHLPHVRRVASHGDFQQRRLCQWRGAPRYRETAAGILCWRRDDTVREVTGRVVPAPRRHLRIGLGSWSGPHRSSCAHQRCADQRQQRQPLATTSPRHHWPQSCGSDNALAMSRQSNATTP